MQPPFPSLTPTWHNEPYAAISPNLPAHSHAGATVLVTGGGRGLGPRFAHAFAKAGAKVIALTGRTTATLEATRAELEKEYPEVKVLAFAADVVDEKAIDAAFAETAETGDKKGIDIVIHNAAVNNPLNLGMAEITGAETRKKWWQTFETNVLGTQTILAAFVKHKAGQNPRFLYISTGSVSIYPYVDTKQSNYTVSKISAAALLQYFWLENPELRVHSLHPGIVETDMGAKARQNGMPIDDRDLSPHFATWLLSNEGAFLQRRTVWTNWDVDELKAQREKFEADPAFLNIQAKGWPFGL